MDRQITPLFSGDKPLMIVEAKKLDTSLRDEKVLTQGLRLLPARTPYLSVTDGRRWEIYETHKLRQHRRETIVQFDEKRIGFDLKNQSAAEACLKALTLWAAQSVRPGCDFARISNSTYSDDSKPG